jgi:hypothetical protein
VNKSSWRWKSCIAGVILAASGSASTNAHAQRVTQGEIADAARAVDKYLNRINSDRFRSRYSGLHRCKVIIEAIQAYSKLQFLLDRADANGQGRAGHAPGPDAVYTFEQWILPAKAEVRIQHYFEDYGYLDHCDPLWLTLPGPGGGGGGGGGGFGPRSARDQGFWFGFQFLEVSQKLNWMRSQGNGNFNQNQFNPLQNDGLPNSGSVTQDPLGVGVTVGYAFTPWSNVRVSPFLSVDYLNMSVAQTFPSGSLVGTTSNFAATAGVKAGPQLPIGLWLYGIAGASALNEKLNVVIGPVSSSMSTTVPGATVGFGGAITPSFLQGFRMPVSVFAEYQHTWWQEASFPTPAASPPFNYNFRRQDDVVKFGFMLSLGSPPPAPSTPAYPVKALPSK